MRSKPLGPVVPAPSAVGARAILALLGRRLLYAGASTAVRGARLRVLCCSRCLRPRLWWAVAVLARRERRQLRTLALLPLHAVHRAASALPQPLPSSSALVGRRRARSTRALPASLRWRFHRFARCRAACALPQPLSSSSALGHRRARSTRASPASLRWRFDRFARFRAAGALLQLLPSSSAMVGRRRARSMRALPASLRWRFHRCARCRAACALPQPLPSSSALGRRRARSLERRQLRFAGASTASRGLGLQVLCCSRCLCRRL
eukprot:scaffold37253_cov42-Phaeocystis_antarctica.AAC.1